MNKNYKYLVYLGAAVLFILVIYLVIKGLQSNGRPADSGLAGNSQNGNLASSSLPSYLLNPDEELRVYEFVKNFLELYNTYSYSDYSNLTALGDYQTSGMQQTTVNYVSFLKKTVLPGYLQEAKADKDSFRYDYPSIDRLIVNLSLTEKKYSNFYPKVGGMTSKPEGEKRIAVELELVKFGKGWLVNNFQIK
jgi:hypothetical protein